MDYETHRQRLSRINKIIGILVVLILVLLAKHGWS